MNIFKKKKVIKEINRTKAKIEELNGTIDWIDYQLHEIEIKSKLPIYNIECEAYYIACIKVFSEVNNLTNLISNKKLPYFTFEMDSLFYSLRVFVYRIIQVNNSFKKNNKNKKIYNIIKELVNEINKMRVNKFFNIIFE